MIIAWCCRFPPAQLTCAHRIEVRMAKTETTEVKETTKQQIIHHRVSWLLWGGLVALVILMVSAFSHA